MSYSIDTSALLDGWVRFYSPDVVPGLWDRLGELVEQGELIATEEVYRELKRKSDDILRWAKMNSRMFIPIDEQIQKEVRKILGAHPKLLDTRNNRSGADPFVIALAKMRSCHVITGEGRTGKPDRPNIPDVCDELSIRSLNVLDLCREQKWIFK